MPSGTRRTALIFFLIVSFASAFAQEKTGKWYGDANVGFGSNFDNGWIDYFSISNPGQPQSFSRISGDTGVKLGWKSEKLEVMGMFAANSSYHLSSSMGVTSKTTQRDTSGSFDVSQKEQISSKYKTGAEISYKPGDYDLVRFVFAHEHEHQTPSNVSAMITYQSSLTGLDEQEQKERGEYVKFHLNPRLSWEHKFLESGESRLLTSLSWKYVKDTRETDYGLMKCRYEEVFRDTTWNIYRLTPQYIDDVLRFDVRYSDKNFCGVDRLDVDFGLNLVKNGDRDSYSGATLVDGEWKDITHEDIWVDSLSLRKSYNYLYFLVEPVLHASYRVENFHFDWSFSPQYFTDRLISSDQSERLDPGRIDMVADLNSWWEPSNHHKLGMLLYKHIERPEYLQMCNFQRPDIFSNNYRRGNPSLKPTSTSCFSAQYQFSWNRFSTALELGFKVKYDQIAQTYNMEEFDGKSVRVFTWINAGESNTKNVRLTMRWSGKIINAFATVNANHFMGYDKEGLHATESNDLEAKGSVSANLPWGINVQVNGRYQSKIVRVYGSMSSYVELSARISKNFKHFGLFLDGGDLLDKPIETGTCSEDESEWRLIETTNNRRIIRLGLSAWF